ncbi:MAG: hypothetical protein J07HX64_02505 [halophilic archaeon J07HX64]|jgi:hypothetical protein|nr:MAG: hypothetical protein J07HX64_02505 [halophilic archaeon J07HX64]
MGYEPVTVREAAQIEVLLFVGLAFVGGLLTIYWGFQTYQFGRLIRDTPPEPVQSVAMGRTEVRGELTPATRVYDQPFTEGQCIYGEFKLREYKDTPDDDNDKQWKTVQKDSFSAPFYVDDGTGQMLVEPNEDTLYEISDTHSVEIAVDGNQPAPDPIQEFLGRGPPDARNNPDSDDGGIRERLASVVGRFDFLDGKQESDELDIDDQGGDPDAVDMDERETDADSGGVERIHRSELGSTGRTGNKRRYIQMVLPVDDEGYVFGGATRPDPNEAVPCDEDILIRSDPSTDEFIISDKGEFSLASTYRNRSAMYIAAAVIVTTLVLALLVQILVTGPLYGIEEALP